MITSRRHAAAFHGKPARYVPRGLQAGYCSLVVSSNCHNSLFKVFRFILLYRLSGKVCDLSYILSVCIRVILITTIVCDCTVNKQENYDSTYVAKTTAYLRTSSDCIISFWWFLCSIIEHRNKTMQSLEVCKQAIVLATGCWTATAVQKPGPSASLLCKTWSKNNE